MHLKCEKSNITCNHYIRKQNWELHKRCAEFNAVSMTFICRVKEGLSPPEMRGIYFHQIKKYEEKLDTLCDVI